MKVCAKITKVKVLKNKRLKIHFHDGKSFVFDMTPHIGKGVSKALEDDKYFSKVKVDEDDTIRWPNEYDICPDLLYLEMKKQLKKQHNQ